MSTLLVTSRGRWCHGWACLPLTTETDSAQQCRGLKDKFGVSWQVVPRVLPEMLMVSDTPKSQRTIAATLKMKKLDIAELQRAHARSPR